MRFVRSVLRKMSKNGIQITHVMEWRNVVIYVYFESCDLLPYLTKIINYFDTQRVFVFLFLTNDKHLGYKRSLRCGLTQQQQLWREHGLHRKWLSLIGGIYLAGFNRHVFEHAGNIQFLIRGVSFELRKRGLLLASAQVVRVT